MKSKNHKIRTLIGSTIASVVFAIPLSALAADGNYPQALVYSPPIPIDSASNNQIVTGSSGSFFKFINQDIGEENGFFIKTPEFLSNPENSFDVSVRFGYPAAPAKTKHVVISQQPINTVLDVSDYADSCSEFDPSKAKASVQETTPSVAVEETQEEEFARTLDSTVKSQQTVKARALRGETTKPFSYGFVPYGEYERQLLPEYKALLQQNTQCKLYHSLEFAEENTAPENDAQEWSYKNVNYRIGQKNAEFRTGIFAAIKNSTSPDFSNVSGYSVDIVNARLAKLNSATVKLYSDVCRIFNSAASQDSEDAVTERFLKNTLEKYIAPAEHSTQGNLYFSKEYSDWLVILVRSLHQKITEDSSLLIDYRTECAPQASNRPPLPTPTGRGGQAALTLLALGYKNVPQTRQDGTHTTGDFSNSPYSVGRLGTFAPYDYDNLESRKSQFALLSDLDAIKGIIGTGIQNAPLDSAGKNPHKFFFETNPIEMRKKQHSIAVEISLEMLKKLKPPTDTKSSNPTVKGYVARQSCQECHTPSLRFSKERLSDLVRSDEYVGPTNYTPKPGHRDFGISFKHQSLYRFFLKPHGARLTLNKSILDMYKEGFNWDEGACKKETDTKCLFAFSFYNSTYAKTFFQLKGSLKNIPLYRNPAVAVSKIMRRVSSADPTNAADLDKYTDGRISAERAAAAFGAKTTTYSGWQEVSNFDSRNLIRPGYQTKADLFFEMSYKQMESATLDYSAFATSLILKPGIFFSPPETVVSAQTLQMKMARYENGGTEGVTAYRINGPDVSGVTPIIEKVSLFGQKESVCAPPLTATMEGGKMFCKGPPCVGGKVFKPELNLCVNENEATCKEPVFTNLKKETNSRTVLVNSCVDKFQTNNSAEAAARKPAPDAYWQNFSNNPKHTCVTAKLQDITLRGKSPAYPDCFFGNSSTSPALTKVYDSTTSTKFQTPGYDINNYLGLPHSDVRGEVDGSPFTVAQIKEKITEDSKITATHPKVIETKYVLWAKQSPAFSYSDYDATHPTPSEVVEIANFVVTPDDEISVQNGLFETHPSKWTQGGKNFSDFSDPKFSAWVALDKEVTFKPSNPPIPTSNYISYVTKNKNFVSADYEVTLTPLEENQGEIGLIFGYIGSTINTATNPTKEPASPPVLGAQLDETPSFYKLSYSNDPMCKDRELTLQYFSDIRDQVHSPCSNDSSVIAYKSLPKWKKDTEYKFRLSVGPQEIKVDTIKAEKATTDSFSFENIILINLKADASEMLKKEVAFHRATDNTNTETFFQPGKFGLFSNTPVVFSDIKISNFKVNASCPAGTRNEVFDGVPTDICISRTQITCGSENEYVQTVGAKRSCSTPIQNCSISDIQEGECKFVATSATSIDVLKHLTSNTFNRTHLSSLAGEDAISPRDIVGTHLYFKESRDKLSSTDRSIIERLNEKANWALDLRDAKYLKLNDILRDIDNTLTNEDIAHALETYDVSEKSKKDFKDQMGLNRENLPFFGIDILKLNTAISLKFREDISFNEGGFLGCAEGEIQLTSDDPTSGANKNCKSVSGYYSGKPTKNKDRIRFCSVDGQPVNQMPFTTTECESSFPFGSSCPKNYAPNSKIGAICTTKNGEKGVVEVPVSYTSNAKPDTCEATKFVCMSSDTYMEGVKKYRWNPFENQQYAPFKLEYNITEGSSSKITLEKQVSLSGLLPPSHNYTAEILATSSEKERNALKVEKIESFAAADSVNSDSIVARTLNCQNYSAEIIQTLAITSTTGVDIGLLSCLPPIESDSNTIPLSRTFVEPFISEGPVSFKTPLKQAPPVIANLGVHTTNPLLKQCVLEVSGEGVEEGKTTIYKIGLRTDSVSKQEYEVPITLRPDPTIFIPHKLTANYLKKSFVNKEILRHISHFLGKATLDNNGELDKNLQNEVIITSQNGKLFNVLTSEGASALAEHIFAKVKRNYPYSKNKLTLSVPLSSFKKGTKFSHDLFVESTGIDNDTYNDRSPLSIHPRSPTPNSDPGNFYNPSRPGVKPKNYLNNGMSFHNDTDDPKNDGYLLSKNILSGDTIVATYRIEDSPPPLAPPTASDVVPGVSISSDENTAPPEESFVAETIDFSFRGTSKSFEGDLLTESCYSNKIADKTLRGTHTFVCNYGTQDKDPGLTLLYSATKEASAPIVHNITSVMLGHSDAHISTAIPTSAHSNYLSPLLASYVSVGNLSLVIESDSDTFTVATQKSIKSSIESQDQSREKTILTKDYESNFKIWALSKGTEKIITPTCNFLTPVEATDNDAPEGYSSAYSLQVDESEYEVQSDLDSTTHKLKSLKYGIPSPTIHAQKFCKALYGDFLIAKDSASTSVSSFAFSGTTSIIPENTTFVSGVPILDGTVSRSVAYTMGGPDSSLFSINPSTGIIISNSVFDFENPTDADADNTYNLSVTATTGSNPPQEASANFTVVVKDVRFVLRPTTETVIHAETYTSKLPVLEGTRTNPIKYTLSGPDSSLFSINPATGIVVSNATFDFENPTDADADNVYDLTITAADSNIAPETASEDFTVAVKQNPFVLIPTQSTISEGVLFTSMSPIVRGNHRHALTYTMSGPDSKLFVIDPVTGIVTSGRGFDFENPIDEGRDNIYNMTITAHDSHPHPQSSQGDFTVIITKFNHAAFSFKSKTYSSVQSTSSGIIWLDRNLGANRVATSFTDEKSVGHLYQWGRPADGHQVVRHPSYDGDYEFTGDDWLRGRGDWATNDSDGSLRAAVWKSTDGSGICPIGYRVPLRSEAAAEAASWVGRSSSGTSKIIPSNIRLPYSQRNLTGYWERGWRGNKYVRRWHVSKTWYASFWIADPQYPSLFRLYGLSNKPFSRSVDFSPAAIHPFSAATSTSTSRIRRHPVRCIFASSPVVVELTPSHTISGTADAPTYPPFLFKNKEYAPILNETTGRFWLDRNLGASRTPTGPDDEASYGDLYQWGRPADGHQLRGSPNSTTQADSITPNHGNFISRWAIDWTIDWSPYNNNGGRGSVDGRGRLRSAFWSRIDGSGICPVGYRVPTAPELDTERNSWSVNVRNDSLAAAIKNQSTGQKSPRLLRDPSFSSANKYWSSTPSSRPVSRQRIATLFYPYAISLSSGGVTDATTKGMALPVRCILDETASTPIVQALPPALIDISIATLIPPVTANPYTPPPVYSVTPTTPVASTAIVIPDVAIQTSMRVFASTDSLLYVPTSVSAERFTFSDPIKGLLLESISNNELNCSSEDIYINTASNQVRCRRENQKNIGFKKIGIFNPISGKIEKLFRLTSGNLTSLNSIEDSAQFKVFVPDSSHESVGSIDYQDDLAQSEALAAIMARERNNQTDSPDNLLQLEVFDTVGLRKLDTPEGTLLENLQKELDRALPVRLKIFPTEVPINTPDRFFTFNTVQNTTDATEVDASVGDSIRHATEVCLGVSNYSEAVLDEMATKKHFYATLRGLTVPKDIIRIAFPNPVTPITNSIKSLKLNQKGRLKLFGIKWGSPSIGEIRKSLRTSTNKDGRGSAENILVKYIQSECASPASAFSRAKLVNRKTSEYDISFCDTAEEFFINDYKVGFSENGKKTLDPLPPPTADVSDHTAPAEETATTPNSIAKYSVEIRIQKYTDLVTRKASIFSKLDGYGANRLNAIIDGKILKTKPHWFKRSHHFSVNSAPNLTAQLLKGIAAHENEFIYQITGASDSSFVPRCVASLGNTGKFKVRNNNLSYAKVFTHPKTDTIINLFPDTLSLTATQLIEYKKLFPGTFAPNIDSVDGSDSATQPPLLNNQPIVITQVITAPDATFPTQDSDENIGETQKEYGYDSPDARKVFVTKEIAFEIRRNPASVFNTDNLSTPAKLSAQRFCQNILPPRISTSHKVFQKSENRKLIEGAVGQTEDHRLMVRSPRIKSEAGYLDAKGAPNWFQDKVCKDTYSFVPLQLDKNKIKNHPDLCDGTIRSGNCALDPLKKPGILRILFSRSKIKKEARDWQKKLIISTETVCGTENTSRTDYATPKNYKDKPIRVLNKSGRLSNILETGVLIDTQETDKAKINIQMISSTQDGYESDTLIINSINLFNTVANKKTGVTRTVPGAGAESNTLPKLDLTTPSPLEQVVLRCNEFKSAYSYRKYNDATGFTHIYGNNLIKEYKNQSADFTFTDPRTNKQRSVRKCSDVFIEKSQTFTVEAVGDNDYLKRQYLREFQKEFSLAATPEKLLTFEKPDIKKAQDAVRITDIDGGFNTEESAGNTNALKRSYSKNKAEGSRLLNSEDAPSLVMTTPGDQDVSKQKEVVNNATGGSSSGGFLSGVLAIAAAAQAIGFLGQNDALERAGALIEKGVKVVGTVILIKTVYDFFKALKDTPSAIGLDINAIEKYKTRSNTNTTLNSQKESREAAISRICTSIQSGVAPAPEADHPNTPEDEEKLESDHPHFYSHPGPAECASIFSKLVQDTLNGDNRENPTPEVPRAPSVEKFRKHYLENIEAEKRERKKINKKTEESDIYIELRRKTDIDVKIDDKTPLPLAEFKEQFEILESELESELDSETGLLTPSVHYSNEQLKVNRNDRAKLSKVKTESLTNYLEKEGKGSEGNTKKFTDLIPFANQLKDNESQRRENIEKAFSNLDSYNGDKDAEGKILTPAKRLKMIKDTIRKSSTFLMEDTHSVNEKIESNRR